MSDPNDLNQNEGDLEIGIDNNSHTPEETITGKRKAIEIDTTGVDNASAILKAITNLQQIAEVNKKNEDRKLREITYNAGSLDQAKKKKFIKYLHEAKGLYLKKPEIIKYIFEHNKIDSAEKGFTLTTMAMAWLECYGLIDSVPLEKMKKRIHSMLFSAVKNYGAFIFGTPISKFKYIYYIAKDPEDYKKQISGLKETSAMFAGVAKDRNSIKTFIELEQAKKEAEEAKQVVEVTNSGEQTTSSSTTEESQPQEQNTQEGGDSEIE